jgi:hypothetical protein
MPPEKTGVSVRKTARYAGNIRGPLHFLRRALVGFLALYFKGPREQKRESVLDRITDLNLDDSKRASLQFDCNLEALFRQNDALPGEQGST